jgi:hypothetical protein
VTIARAIAIGALVFSEARCMKTTCERGSARRRRAGVIHAMRIVRIAVSLALLLAVAARPTMAQTLHGSVRDSVSREPISGAVVMLLDSSGTVLRRNITDERGQYRVAVANHMQSLRVVRIGFQPRSTNVPSPSNRAASLDVGMLPFRTTLAAINVTDQTRCARRSDAAAAAGLWEQARAGLLATVVAQEENPATLHRLGFVRTMDGNSDRVTRFLVASDSVSGVAKSFLAAFSAAVFVKLGFEKDSAGHRVVFAPDAEVLLDDAFVDGYCFRVADPSRARPHEVGLAFGAVDRQPGRVDIDGTLWIDTVARALRDIEFRYVGLPARTDAFHPGGVISFRQMTNGVVLLDRWFLHNVAMTQDTVHDLSILEGDDRRVREWLYAVENGGEVARATWPDGQTWYAALGALQLHLAAAQGRTVAGTVVALAGTPYRATADTSGNIVIADLLPGPYSVEIIDPRLARLGLAIPTSLKFVVTRDSTVRTTMTIPTAEEYAKDRCVASAKRFAVGDSVFILGRVVTSDGKPIADAKVTSAVRVRTGVWRWQSGAYRTGADGIFQICTRDFDLHATVMIRAELTSQNAPVQTVETTRTLSTNLTVVPVVVNGAAESPTARDGLSPAGGVNTARTTATDATGVSAGRTGAQGSIAGIVYDSLASHAPVASATVVIIELSRYATTDARGRFRLDSVPAGRYTLGFTFATLDALDLTLPTMPVEVVAGRRSAITLASPGAATVYTRLCPGPRDPDTGIILGRVRDVDDHTPLADATITTDWTEFTLKAGRTMSDRVGTAVRTNASGAYLLCGVPARVALDVSSEHAGFTAGPTSLVMDSSLIRRVDFAISRRDTAARAVQADSPVQDRSALRGTASLRGVVLGSDGRPLRDAAVSIVGSPDSARTDATGVFHLEGIPAGTRSVQVRSIGLLPTKMSMDFATNGARDTTLSMTRKAQELPAVSVEGQANAASWMVLSGFEERWQHGLGAYVTEQEIARHNFPDLISILRNVRGMHVEYIGKMQRLPMPYLLGGSTTKCTPNFFVDGAPYPVTTPGEFDDLSAMMRPNVIRGIEVYSNPGSMPAQYDLTSSTGCGSIVIWTH